MASTYTNNLAVELITTGEQAGAWGTTTNDNWKRIEESVSAYASIPIIDETVTYNWTLADDVSAYTAATTSTPGSSGRAAFVEFTTDSGTVSTDLTVTVLGETAGVYPNRVFFVRNSLYGTATLTLTVGGDASSKDVEIQNGATAIVYVKKGATSVDNIINNVFANLQVDNLNMVTGSSEIVVKDADATALAIKSSGETFVTFDSTTPETDFGSVDVDINGGAIDGTIIGGAVKAAGSFTTAVTTSTITAGGNIILENGETISNASNDIVAINADTFVVGAGDAAAIITSSGDFDLTLQTGNSSTGTIAITDGADQDITITPNGTGDVLLVADKVTVGDSGAAATIASNGAGDLWLRTGSGTTGAITLEDGTNGNIILTPHGTGEVDITKVDIDGGTIDGTVIGSSVAAAATFSTATITTATINTAIVPDSSGSADLGSTTAEWGDIYIAADKTIYLGDDQRYLIQNSGHDIVFSRDTTATDFSMVMKANKGTAVKEQWQLLINDATGLLSFRNDPVTPGTFVDHLTIAPNATPLESLITTAGSLTVGKGALVHGKLTASSGIDIDGPWSAAGVVCGDLGTVSTVVINAGTITGITDLAVADGGTGRSTLGDTMVLLGNGTGGIDQVDLGNRQVLIGQSAAGTNPAAYSLSGDATMTNAGVVTVVAAPADALTGTELKSTVVTSSLTAVGTIVTGVWTGTAVADAYVANDLTISGGTVNSSIIGGSTPAAGTFTTLNANTSITSPAATITTATIDTATINTAILADADGGATLGEALNGWGHVYIDDGSRVYLGVNDSGSEISVQGSTGSGDLGFIRFNRHRSSAPFNLILTADANGIEAGDNWRIQTEDSATGSRLRFQNDTSVSDTYITFLTITPNATVANSTVAVAGNLTVATDITVTGDILPNAAGASDIGAVGTEWGDIYLANNKHVYLDGGGADPSVDYKLGTASGLFELTRTGTVGNQCHFVLRADNGADAGDSWKILIQDSSVGQMEFQSDLASKGSFVKFFAINAHATPASSTVEVVGNLTTGGTINSTGAITGDLTGNADTATALETGRTIAMTGDVAWTSPTFDGSGNVTAASTINAASVEKGMIDTTNSLDNLYLKGNGSGGLIWAEAASSGDVTTTGGTINQICYFEGTDSIIGDTGLTYVPSTDTLTTGSLVVGDNLIVNAGMQMYGDTASEVTLYVRGASGQSANIVHVVNSAGDPFFEVESDGTAQSRRLVVQGTTDSVTSYVKGFLDQTEDVVQWKIDTTAGGTQTKLWMDSTGKIVIEDVDINSGVIDGTAIGSSSTSTGAFTNVTVSGDILSTSAGASDLGSTTAEWGDIYIADNKEIIFGNDHDFTIGHNTGQGDALHIYRDTLSPGVNMDIFFGVDSTAPENGDTWLFKFLNTGGGSAGFQIYNNISSTDTSDPEEGQLKYFDIIPATATIDSTVTVYGKLVTGSTINAGGQITGNLTGEVTGNASTATELETSRTIGGVSFDGTSNIVPDTITVAASGVDTVASIAMFNSATGDQQPKTDTGIVYNTSTNALTATTFIGALTGTASIATNATTASVATQSTVTLSSGDSNAYIGLWTNTTGDQGAKTDGGFFYNQSTNSLKIGSGGSFIGDLTGNADTATTATTVAGITVANGLIDTSAYLVIADGNGSGKSLYVNNPGDSTDVKVNTNTGALTAYSFTGRVISTSATITGGTINSSSIGLVTPSPGVFTSLLAETSLQVDGDILGTGNVTGSRTWQGVVIGTTYGGTGRSDGLSVGIVGLTATASDLNVLNGITSSTAELNILTGVTATTTELNLLDNAKPVSTSVFFPGSDGTPTGVNNTAVGVDALNSLAAGDNNTAFGTYAGMDMTGGSYNLCMGSSAGQGIFLGSYNVCVGHSSGIGLVTHNGNTCIGAWAGKAFVPNTLNSYNTAVGIYASGGSSSQVGKESTFIGAQAGSLGLDNSNVVCLGYAAQSSATDVSNEITLGNSSITTLRCEVELTTFTSDERDKKDISSLDVGLDFVNSLNPVKFKYDQRSRYAPLDENGIIEGEIPVLPQDGSLKDADYTAGFIAQEVASLEDSIGGEWLNIAHRGNGDFLSITSARFIPPLVKAVQELSSQVTALEARLAALES